MSKLLDYENPYKKPGKPFEVPYYLHIGAGPGNASVEVLNAMMIQPCTPINKKFFKIMDDVKFMTKYLYQTNNPLTLVLQSASNGGNEAMITNLVDPGEKILVAIGGVWGNKCMDMAQRYKIEAIELRTEPGEVFSFEYLEAEIIKHKPVVLFITQGESSGGTLQPLDGLGEICHRHNCLLAVDAVVSIAVVPFFMDRWGIDAVTGGSQKGIGTTAGLCLMSFSPRAHERMKAKKTPPAYAHDILALAGMWQCFGEPRSYHYTYSSNNLNSLRQGLVNICNEGLVNVWKRHQAASDLFISHFERLGLRHFVEKPANRFPGVVCTVLPKDVHWTQLLERALTKHGVEFSFGIGPTWDKAIRVGFLATNACPEVANFVVEVMEESLDYCKNNVVKGIEVLFQPPTHKPQL